MTDNQHQDAPIGFRGERGKPTHTTTSDWINMAPLPDASIRIYYACRMFILKDGRSVVSLTNEEIAQLVPYENGSVRSARSVHNAMRPLFQIGLFVEVETTKVSVEIPEKKKREVRTVRTFAIRDEPLAGYATYTGPVNPFSERERMAAERQAAVERRRAAADAATSPTTPSKTGQKDLSVQPDQGEAGVSAGHTDRKDFAPAKKDLSAAVQDLSGIGSKYLEVSTREDSLRSSGAGDDGDNVPSTEAGRTDESSSATKKTHRVRGINLAAPVQVDGQTITVTGEHQAIAENLAAELGLTGTTATDPDLSAQVVVAVGMWTQQRRDLRKLLPRAVAAADGNADAVRGWLSSKGAAAERATFVLDAFSDEHIADVHHCAELEHVNVRRQRQEAAQRANQDREQRLNARAERETPDPAPWTPHGGSQRPSTESDEASADPARDLAAAVELPFELTRMERTQLTVAIDDFGYETIACAVKTMLTEGTADQMRQVLRTGLLRSQLQ